MLIVNLYVTVNQRQSYQQLFALLSLFSLPHSPLQNAVNLQASNAKMPRNAPDYYYYNNYVLCIN